MGFRCRGREVRLGIDGRSSRGNDGDVRAVSAQTANAQDVKPIKLAVLGDSLTAGYGLPASAAFPVRLQKALAEKGIVAEVHNAGGVGRHHLRRTGPARLVDPQGTEAVIVELGANDALRGVDPQVARGALDDILNKLKARNIAVLLCGMYAPPNYGADYTAKFNSIYPDPREGSQSPALSVLSRWCGHRREADPARRTASDRRRCRCRGEADFAHG